MKRAITAPLVVGTRPGVAPDRAASRERMVRSKGLATGALVGCLLAALPLHAFKIDTHVWIAQQVLNDLLPDGRLTVEPFGEFPVRPEILEALRNFPREYRMGSVGPDGFPDLVAGQLTAHPGVPDGWVTDHWLRHVLESARTPEELAFALGYLSHAAGDLFAHTYVNLYAGDVFSLTDGEIDVEVRHTVLEEYILKRQPPLRDGAGRTLFDHDEVEVPVGFVRDILMLDPEVSRQYGMQPATSYVQAMVEFWRFLDDSVKDIEKVQASIQKGQEAIRKDVRERRDRISSLKNKKVELCTPRVCAFGVCTPRVCTTVKLWPAYCFIDPATCTLVASLELGLATLEAQLGVAEEIQQFLVTSTISPLLAWRADVKLAITEYVPA